MEKIKIPDSTDYPREFYEDMENKIKNELNSIIKKYADKGFQVHKIVESKTDFCVGEIELLNKISERLHGPYQG